MKQNRASVHDCVILDLPKIERPSGNLTVIHGGVEIPFDIRRVYYLYDVPGGASRGGHAHKTLYQLIIAASGSFDIVLSDGVNSRTVQLNRPYVGLLIPPGIWRDMSNFSSGASCVVIASEVYQEEDYIRDYQSFLAWK